MGTAQLEREGALALLTLDNPPLNQISEQVVDDLEDVVAALEAADDVRALLVRGAGEVFDKGSKYRDADSECVQFPNDTLFPEGEDVTFPSGGP